MFFLFTFLFTTLSSAHAARILALYPLGAKSHHYYLHTVAKTLARAGHEVDVYSPFPNILGDNTANLTHYHLKNMGVLDQKKELFPLFEEITNQPCWRCLDLFWTDFNLYEEFIKDKETKRLLASGKQFDLIIGEVFNNLEFLPIFSRVFNAPFIALQAFPTNSVLNKALGNSLSTSFIPDVCSPYSDKMNLIQRTINTLSIFRGLYYHYTYYYRGLENIVRQDFPDSPPIEELVKNISLVFVNDHLTADYAQPRSPNIIPIGGLHINPAKPLPQNIAEFMGNATDGVIFFSLGTYVTDDLKPKQYFDMYINIFKQLKQRVIWKTRKVNIEGLPENVLALNWAPQKDILAHPSCVLFITHGGQNSLLEAFHFGVPVISIPQFFDQHRNSELYVSKGVGISMSINEVSEVTMAKAINKVINDSSYVDTNCINFPADSRVTDVGKLLGKLEKVIKKKNYD